MVVSVRTYERVAEAASALSAERDAYFMGGGTLIMRGVNEGDPRLSTVIRTTSSKGIGSTPMPSSSQRNRRTPPRHRRQVPS